MTLLAWVSRMNVTEPYQPKPWWFKKINFKQSRFEIDRKMDVVFAMKNIIIFGLIQSNGALHLLGSNLLQTDEPRLTDTI